jgi:hypothetical protein
MQHRSGGEEAKDPQCPLSNNSTDLLVKERDFYKRPSFHASETLKLDWKHTDLHVTIKQQRHRPIKSSYTRTDTETGIFHKQNNNDCNQKTNKTHHI